ncbi:retrovirus-related pol polyprotein from transposon TNT 1-94 [Tanacetum coccineum]
MDMFRDTHQLLVETPENLFVTPANIHTIEAFMNRVGYQGVVDKVSAFFTKNLAQPWQTMFKVFNRFLKRTSGHDQTKINILQLFHAKSPNIPKRIDEDYHSIKDDVPLVTEIRETDDFNKYETVFMKIEEGERMWHSIQHGPYQRPMVPSYDNPEDQILEPLSKITKGDKRKYIADVRVMNYILQARPNHIYNSVDACANAKEMWERIKRLMHGSNITATVRHSRLMDEFDKFAAKEGESLDSVHERLTTLVNIMDRNNVRPIPVAINTKAKKAAKNHHLLVVTAHSNASSSHLHANSSYSPQSYYVTYPPSVVDYDDKYQGELQEDSQEDKLKTAMILLARAISQKFSSPTNNRYGGIAIKNLGRNRNQMFHAGNASDESNQIIQRVPRTDSTPSKANVQFYNCNEKGHYACDCQKPKVHNAKYAKTTDTGSSYDDKAVKSAQPKMYDRDMLYSEKLIINSTDSEKTLKDVEENQIKMKDKMIQVNYDKINALYKTFVPQQEISPEETYFSIPSTSNHSFEYKDVPSESPVLKMPNESRLLKMIDKLGNALTGSYTKINKTLLKDADRRWLSDSQNELREFYKTDVILTSRSLYNNLKDITEELIEETHAYGDVRAENQDLLMIISELKSKLRTIEKGKNVNTMFDSSETLGKHVCVTPFNKQIAHKSMNASNTKVNSDRSKPVTSQSTPKPEQGQNHNENVITRGMYKINKQYMKTLGSKANTNVSNFIGVESSHSVRRSTSKDIKSKNSILKNTKSSSTYVWKTLNSACLYFNKSDTKTSNICQTNACISNSKTVKACVNVVKDGSNIVCISYGNEVFLNSHEKCVARHALSRKSSVKRALFTSPLAAKSRLSVAKTPTTTSKVSSALPPSSYSRTTIDGLPKLKYTKDHLCSAWEQGKSKKASLPLKLVPSTESKLKLLHMDLYGPMRVASTNGKKYILVIVDDYSRYTWVYFLLTKYEAPDMIIDFVNQVQRNLKDRTLTIQTDNGTEFKNVKLGSFYA